MRKMTYVIAVCLLALATAATAATVGLTMDNLTANGWKVTATSVYGGTTNASVTQTNDYGGVGNFKFITGSMPTSWQFQWAGISTNAFSGMTLASITSAKIRVRAQSADNLTTNQPPTFTWVVQKDANNQRCISWKAWANGNTRTQQTWLEYDCATTGQWRVYETGVNYNSLAALQAALPNAWFADTSKLPIAYGYASQQAFNVGQCPLYDEDRAWWTGATGYVDWFEVGVNGVDTRYDLGYVPEPSGVLALCAGVLGMLGTIRRRK
jgi:hypothetical protein